MRLLSSQLLFTSEPVNLLLFLQLKRLEIFRIDYTGSIHGRSDRVLSGGTYWIPVQIAAADGSGHAPFVENTIFVISDRRLRVCHYLGDLGRSPLRRKIVLSCLLFPDFGSLDLLLIWGLCSGVSTALGGELYVIQVTHEVQWSFDFLLIVGRLFESAAIPLN